MTKYNQKHFFNCSGLPVKGNSTISGLDRTMGL